ncbi:DUF5133 domain-containing protein [Streptomyces sp. AP-93]|uniref:DUF5133 domain-containing protein n=1 Tax=Streptomyces sp. AP-93 TaxID=2929048 RepID=UPI001FAF7DAE|nr:DUF5133 domain-containing protein [Streptomyces sp. AP-93]MCJ0869741.1 DUF5133 domain-containing protein [Streptomyces sp. AP-93]
MDHPAQQPRTPAAPAEPPRPQEVRATAARAVGVLMALVPCTAAKARRILAEVVMVTGTEVREAAEAVLAVRTGEPVAPAVESVLRHVLAQARTLPDPPAGSWSPPEPDLLRRHVNHLRAARRRALAAPGDASVRSELEEAAYTLCVLMGQRSAHGALLAAEQLIAVSRLKPVMPARSG